MVDRCFTRKSSGKSIDHLLLHCHLALDIWSFIFSLLGLSWVIPNSVVGLLECLQGQFQCHKASKVWRALPLCVVWILWLERKKQASL